MKSEELFETAKKSMETYSTMLFTYLVLEAKGIDVEERLLADQKYLETVKQMIQLAVGMQKLEEKRNIHV